MSHAFSNHHTVEYDARIPSLLSPFVREVYLIRTGTIVFREQNHTYYMCLFTRTNTALVFTINIVH
jgi:hypothetical protein